MQHIIHSFLHNLHFVNNLHIIVHCKLLFGFNKEIKWKATGGSSMVHFPGPAALKAGATLDDFRHYLYRIHNCTRVHPSLHQSPLAVGSWQVMLAEKSVYISVSVWAVQTWIGKCVKRTVSWWHQSVYQIIDNWYIYIYIYWKIDFFQGNSEQSCSVHWSPRRHIALCLYESFFVFSCLQLDWQVV